MIWIVVVWACAYYVASDAIADESAGAGGNSFLLMAIGCFFHAKTRIPYFAKGYSIAYLIVSIGPFMIIPNVGLNEWGHTFWFMEELFVAPLHWGFVFFGWMALGVFGVVIQLLLNIHRVIGKEGVELLTGA